MEVRQALLTLLNLRRDQREREAAFLREAQADRRCHCCGEAFDRCRDVYRGDDAWRRSQLPRDVDGFLCIEDMDPCDEAWFYDVTAGRA